MRLLPIVVLFLLGPAGAWAWFHVGTPPQEVVYEFAVRTNLPGLRFTPIPVGAKEMDILATTNLLNGEFSDGRNTVTVFAADWEAEKAREMSMLGHTPDVCWVSIGFKSARLGQPMIVDISLDSGVLPFECRAFIAPQTGQTELTLWCTLVGGRPLEGGFRFLGSVETDGEARADSSDNSRRRGANMFLRAVAGRIPSNGRKQFVRLSTRVQRGDWKAALDSLEAFAPGWIELTAIRPPPRAID